MSLDAGGAIKGLESIGRSADRNLGRAESKLDKMGQRFQKAGVGMLAGAGLAATGLYKAGQAAADLEQAVGGTEAVFKDTSGLIDKFAKNAASKMGLSERAFREATTSIGGQLKGLGFSVEEAADQAVDLTGVAADLAATYGGTTAEAVQALGAAFRGEADPAERFNLFLNQNRVNAEAVALGLAKTTSSVDANAKAQATLSLITKQSADALGQFGREAGSASGQMQIASAEFENAKAALGQSVAPILAGVAGGLADVAGGFSAINEKSDGALSKVATFGTIALGAAGGVSFITGKILTMRDRLDALSEAAPRVTSALKSMAGPAITLGIIGLVDALEPLKFMNDAGANIEELELNLARLGRGASVEDLGIDIDKLGSAIERVADPSSLTRVDNAITELATLGGFADFGKDSDLDQARQRIDELDEALTNLDARDAVAAQDALAVVADELGMSVSDLLPLLDSYSGSLDAAETNTVLAGKATAQLAEDEGELAERLKETTEAFGGLLDAVLAQFDADIGYRRSLNDTEDALADVNTALKEHGRGSEEYERSLLDAESALLDQAEAAVRLYEDTAAANGQTITAAEKAAIYRGTLEELAGTVDGPLRTALDGHIGTLAAIPADVRTKVLVDAGGAFETVRELLGYMDAIGAKGSATGFSGLLKFKQDRMRADGGPVSAGTPYVVGEDGPEVFVPNRSGTIVPNGQMSAPSGGAAGGAVGVINHINIHTAADPQAVVEAVSRYVRTNGQPGWNR